MKRLLLAVLLIAVTSAAFARERGVVRAFKKQTPCPYRHGDCIADHIMPLCAGGPDVIGNLQWQMVAAAKEKDRGEHALCRQLRKGKPL